MFICLHKISQQHKKFVVAVCIGLEKESQLKITKRPVVSEKAHPV